MKKRKDLRTAYELSRVRDYTRYSALVGESVAAKVDLLSNLLGPVHEGVLGRYKERLLARAIASFLPRQYEVGTGFVLFPTERSSDDQEDSYIRLNRSDFLPSREIDILVYDASRFPVVFRDDEFVVVRPEAVCAIIEVKGTLSRNALKSTLDSFTDFGLKWQAVADFYRRMHATPLPKPPLLSLFCWSVAIRPNGGAELDGRSLREAVVRHYRRGAPSGKLIDFPILESAYVYRNTHVSATHWTEGDLWSFGFVTQRGQMGKRGPSNDVKLVGDSTIAWLLAEIQYRLQGSDLFNRFFAYADEGSHLPPEDYPEYGYTPWLVGDKELDRLRNREAS